MFYFGGMTLGYLESPAQRAASKHGENLAQLRRDETVKPERSEPIPTMKALIARANWFSLYW